MIKFLYKKIFYFLYEFKQALLNKSEIVFELVMRTQALPRLMSLSLLSYATWGLALCVLCPLPEYQHCDCFIDSGTTLF